MEVEYEEDEPYQSDPEQDDEAALEDMYYEAAGNYSQRLRAGSEGQVPRCSRQVQRSHQRIGEGWGTRMDLQESHQHLDD